MQPPAIEYLRHILDETRYLIAERKGLSKQRFIRDETIKRAFVRSIEIIGEALKKLPAEFKSKYSRIEWRAIAGMRDRLVHGYFGVDYDIVWDVVQNKVPILQDQIFEILKQEEFRSNQK